MLLHIQAKKKILDSLDVRFGRAQYLSFIFDVTINDLLYVFHNTARRSTLHVLLVEDSKKFRGEDFFSGF